MKTMTQKEEEWLSQIGAYVSELLSWKGTTYREAKALGVNPCRLIRMKRGAGDSINLLTLKRIADLCEIEIEELIVNATKKTPRL